METTKTPYSAHTTALHVHKYSVDGKLPADVMASATRDLVECMSSVNEIIDNPGSLISAVINQENGGMYFEWSEESEADVKHSESTADVVETSYIHVYVIDKPSASTNEIRSTIEAAEKEAFEYAEANDLEYSSDIIGVSFSGEAFTVVWSTAAE